MLQAWCVLHSASCILHPTFCIRLPASSIVDPASCKTHDKWSIILDGWHFGLHASPILYDSQHATARAAARTSQHLLDTWAKPLDDHGWNSLLQSPRTTTDETTRKLKPYPDSFFLKFWLIYQIWVNGLDLNRFCAPEHIIEASNSLIFWPFGGKRFFRPNYYFFTK